MRRLSKTELTGYRKRWQRENPRCPLCARMMDTDTVVDHDHRTGECRAVICRWCNAVLGKIENWAFRIGNGVDPLMFLGNVSAYLDHASTPGAGKGVIYPSHKTEDEKRLARNKKARVARAKAKLAKEN
ncbi:endonuclease domain-containing protein [Burkholderia vietnamiensis]|uniref:endonuclease domain-containing protein n=1 Tax=Burkholderia vietnamiensis TaxID=60552 RepID=UPI001592D8E2|nr:endonuclease domain-containing protein [Burkholderia vietnamiensis]